MNHPIKPNSRRRFLTLASAAIAVPMLDACGDNATNVNSDAMQGQPEQPLHSVNKRQLGPGRTRGMFFGVDENKQLRWHRYLGLDAWGDPTWHPKGGAVVGHGWNFAHIVAADDGVMFAVDARGIMRWYQYTGDAGQFAWHPNSSRVVGHGWFFEALTYVGNGTILAITKDGDMRWYGYQGGSGGFRWHPDSGRKVGSGWSNTQLAGNGNGTLYAVTGDGKMAWHQLIDTNGALAWDERSASNVGHGWGGYRVMGQGDGVLFYADAAGNTSRIQDMARNGSWAWDTGSGASMGMKLPYAQLMVAFNNNALAGGGVIAAYVGPSQSFAPGDALTLHVSTIADSFAVIFYQCGMPGGNTNTGLVDTGVSISATPGALQPVPAQAWGEGCAWPAGVQTTVPTTWTSGMYAARLQDSFGEVAWATFIVRPAPGATKKRFAVLANINTWNAYNTWGGRSNYSSVRGVRLAFDRPHASARPIDEARQRQATSGVPGSANPIATELWGHAWLRRQGFEFDLYTDVDLERGTLALADYSSLLLVNHPEYWTERMYDKLDAYLSLPARNLFYLGGNGIYESMAYSRDWNTMVMRKGDDNVTRYDVNFSSPSVNKPQARLLGIAFTGQNYNTYAPYKVQQAGHRFFAGTGLKDGDLLGERGLAGPASGCEFDGRVTTSPADVTVLARGTNQTGDDTFAAEMVAFRASGGGLVFSVGSLTFIGALAVDATLGTIVSNALREG